MKQTTIVLIESTLPWLAPLIGGLVDYFNQIQKGTKIWSVVGFLMHLASALFFGWLCALTADGLEYNRNVIYAAGGMGGFLGVRVADLITHTIDKLK